MMALQTLKDQCCRFYGELPTWGKAAFAGGVIIALYVPFKCYRKQPRKSPLKEDFVKDFVYLYQFPRAKYIPNVSPYCLKLETWLRIAEIPYENVDCGWTTRSGEGTVPFIEYNGREYPDSALAIRDMTAIHAKESMESHLTEEQRCTARAFEKLAECSLMQTVSYIRYSEYLDEMVGQLPVRVLGCCTNVILWMVKHCMATKKMETLRMSGIGKHSRLEILNIAAEDLRAISRYLGTKDYLHGFKATAVDATLFGVLAQIVYAPYDLPQKQFVHEELQNLKDYCERIKERYWPDWDECVTTFALNAHRTKKF